MVNRELYELLRERVHGIGGRVYRSVAPQATQDPCVVFELADVERFHAFGADADVQVADYDVTVFGPRAAGLDAFDVVVANARSVLSRHRGGVITDILIESEDADFDHQTDLYSHTFDIRIFYGSDGALTALAGLSSDATPAASEFTIMPSDGEPGRFALQPFAAQYLMFARLATEPYLGSVVFEDDPTHANVLGGWTPSSFVRIGGSEYRTWVSNQALTISAVTTVIVA